MRRLENILEDTSNVWPRLFIRVKSESSITEVERSNIIKTKNVVGMTVCNQNGIKSLACSMRTETRNRLSRGSTEVQVSHSQPMDGTPVEVPVPRKVSFMA
jgi:hypothetical protein